MKMFGIFAFFVGGVLSNSLPVDEVMASFEEEIPELRQYQEQLESELSELGPPETDWTDRGLTVPLAIADAGGNVSTHVLGEWEVGGHSVNISGDRPLDAPDSFIRYSVREHEGPIDYHYYYRVPSIPEAVIIHFFGSKRAVGNAACSDQGGMEVLASKPWEAWSADTTFVAFAGIRLSRDDNRIYCSIYEPALDGGYYESSYNPDGKPYLAVNADPRTLTVGTRLEASMRIFEVLNKGAAKSEN